MWWLDLVSALTPPCRSATLRPMARRTNVSEPLTEILGRDALLDRAHEMLDEGSRWISLRGPAGVGKTRALTALAAGLSPRELPGGIWYCSLAGARDEEEVCVRVASVLPDVDAHALPRNADELESALKRSGAMVLVLDHAEHAAETLSRCLPRWLRGAASLRCLVGTRERLGGAGEVVLRVEPLSAAAAQRLFVQRARTARGEELSAEERALVDEITKLLDRLPLGIELAAAQLSVLSVRELLDSLERSVTTLASPDRSATRHASLDAALGVSWKMLTEAQQEALRSIALYESTPDLAAIEALLPQRTDVISMLTALGDRSWLQVERGAKHRYRLLHVVRAFIREAEGGDESRLHRYVDHVATVGTSLLEKWGEREATIALGDLVPDLISAMDLAFELGWDARPLGIVLGRVATARGPVPLALGRLSRALELRGDQDATRVDALLIRGRLHARNAQPTESRDDYERALQVSDAIGDSIRSVRVATALADHLRHHAEVERAEELYRRVLESATDLRPRARLLASLAGLIAERGELEDAERSYREAIAAARAADDAMLEAVTMQNLGLLLQERGELDRAETLYRDALQRHEALSHRRFESIAHLDLAGLALERGRAVEGKAEAALALELAERAGDRREGAIAEMLSGVALSMLGEIDAAEVAFTRAGSALALLDEPGLAAAHEIHRRHLPLARSELAEAEVLAMSPEGDDARLAVRVLRAAFARAREKVGALAVALDGVWFRPHEGDVVDLEGRAALRGVLAALADAALQDPEARIAADALIAAGWPDKRSTTKAAKNRLHVALATLRKLGLANHLERDGAGYRLVRVIVEAND